METTEMKSAKETHEYIWNHSIYDIAKDIDKPIPSQEVLSLDKDTLIKRLANAVANYYPPYTNKNDERTLFYAQMLENAVNDYNFGYKAFAEYVTTQYHRTLQQSTMRLILTIIKAFANVDDNCTDARNNETVRLAKLINEVLEREGYQLPLI